MPKETVSDACQGAFDVKVGWAAHVDVQVGVEKYDGGSLFWELFSPEDIGELIHQLCYLMTAQQQDKKKGSTEDLSIPKVMGATFLNALDARTGSYAGLWSTLDREGCNRLIRTLRRARDSAFGADA